MSDYSEILMDHFSRPRNQGPMENPDRIGLVGTPGNGPYMLLSVRLKEGKIIEAAFQTYGCGASIASGSMLTVMIVNRLTNECLQITPEQLIDALGGVPPNKLHAPALAVGALRCALQNA